MAVATIMCKKRRTMPEQLGVQGAVRGAAVKRDIDWLAGNMGDWQMNLSDLAVQCQLAARGAEARRVGSERVLTPDRPARRAADSGSRVLPLLRRPPAALPLPLGLLAQPPPAHRMQHATQRRRAPTLLPPTRRAQQAVFRRAVLLHERRPRGQQLWRPMPLPLPPMLLQLPSVHCKRPAKAWAKALARGPPVAGQAVPLLSQLPPAADLSSPLAAAASLSAPSVPQLRGPFSAKTPACPSPAEQTPL